MPRFVVLTHDHPYLHWDFLLEVGGSLRSWRLLNPPDSPGAIPAEPLPDHRRVYLEYEGPVGGGRGSVSRWDAGTYQTHKIAETCLALELRGVRLQGRYRLERQEGEHVWHFTQQNSAASCD